MTKKADDLHPRYQILQKQLRAIKWRIGEEVQGAEDQLRAEVDAGEHPHLLPPDSKAMDKEVLKARRDVVKPYVSFVEEWIADIKNEYQAELAPRQGGWPRRWMASDPGIRDSKVFRRTRLADFYNYLWETTANTANKEESDRLAAPLPEHRRSRPVPVKSGERKGQTDRRDLMLLQIDNQDAAKRLGLSPGMVTKYIRACVDLGILEKVVKPGPHSGYIYAIGTRVGYEGSKFNRVSFVSDTPEWRRKLASFNLQQGRGRSQK